MRAALLLAASLSCDPVILGALGYSDDPLKGLILGLAIRRRLSSEAVRAAEFIAERVASEERNIHVRAAY